MRILLIVKFYQPSPFHFFLMNRHMRRRRSTGMVTFGTRLEDEVFRGIRVNDYQNHCELSVEIRFALCFGQACLKHLV